MRVYAAAALASVCLAACDEERTLGANYLPRVRPGQWAFTGETRGVPSAGKVCLKGFADTIGRWYKGCRPFEYRRRGDATIVRSHCVNPNGTKVDSEMTFRGDYARAFSMDDHIVITRTAIPLAPTDIHIRYRYDNAACDSPSPGG